MRHQGDLEFLNTCTQPFSTPYHCVGSSAQGISDIVYWANAERLTSTILSKNYLLYWDLDLGLFVEHKRAEQAKLVDLNL